MTNLAPKTPREIAEEILREYTLNANYYEWLRNDIADAIQEYHKRAGGHGVSELGDDEIKAMAKRYECTKENSDKFTLALGKLMGESFLDGATWYRKQMRDSTPPTSAKKILVDDYDEIGNKIKVWIDPSVPENEIHFKNPVSGETVGKIVNVKEPPKDDKRPTAKPPGTASSSFEAIARKLLNNLNSEIPIHFHNGTQEEGYESDVEDITTALSGAYAAGQAAERARLLEALPSEDENEITIEFEKQAIVYVQRAIKKGISVEKLMKYAFCDGADWLREIIKEKLKEQNV